MRPLLASLLVVTLALPACAPVGSGPQLIISANENRLDLAYGAMKVFGDPSIGRNDAACAEALRAMLTGYGMEPLPN